jgi:selenocysteine lyase/cysteine desulfurase
MNKREFVRTMGSASLGLMFSPDILSRLTSTPSAELAQDEAFWKAIRGKYRLTSDYINLESGYYSMRSEEVLEGFIASVRKVNYEAARYMRTVRVDDKNRIRDKLAALAGCSPEELIITRNTTESLDTVISGFDWKPGDEAVMAMQDYGAMVDQFKLQARRTCW